MIVVAEPESALLASAAALRRLGAKLTRYDTDDGMLEARAGAAAIRIAVTSSTTETSRLRVDADGASARLLVRRFRAELTRAPREVSR
jgi:hypothetical protein